MCEIEHTESCKRDHIKAATLRIAYAKQWPDHCRTCEGSGGHWYSFDPSPAGISLSPGTMEDFEPCFDCLEQDVCPRCSKEVWGPDDWNGDPVVCPLCGWSEKSPDSMPAEAECWCWEGQDDMEEQLFSTKDAAAYLGLSRQGLWYHIQKRHISGKLIGNSLVFTRAQLDEFQATRRKPGRPKVIREEND